MRKTTFENTKKSIANPILYSWSLLSALKCFRFRRTLTIIKWAQTALAVISLVSGREAA